MKGNAIEQKEGMLQHNFVHNIGLIKVDKDLVYSKDDCCLNCCLKSSNIIWQFGMLTVIFAGELLSGFFTILVFDNREKDIYYFSFTLVNSIFNAVFGWTVLVNLYYSHHILSMAILLIGFSLVNLTHIINGIQRFNYWILITTFVIGISSSVAETKLKLLMIDKAIIPKQILLVKGLMDSILLLGMLLMLRKSSMRHMPCTASSLAMEEARCSVLRFFF